MARNEEKSHSMLNRWVTMKREQEGKGSKKPTKRPYLSSMVNTLTDAEHWRTDLLKEISKSVMAIQNRTLSPLLPCPQPLPLDSFQRDQPTSFTFFMFISISEEGWPLPFLPRCELSPPPLLSSYLSPLATLEEHKIRDLNDKINKLFREKWHWNNRIKELGGPDYRVPSPSSSLSFPSSLSS